MGELAELEEEIKSANQLALAAIQANRLDIAISSRIRVGAEQTRIQKDVCVRSCLRRVAHMRGALRTASWARMARAEPSAKVLGHFLWFNPDAPLSGGSGPGVHAGDLPDAVAEGPRFSFCFRRQWPRRGH